MTSTVTTTLVRRARARPMPAFVVLAFALSWLAWTPYVLSAQGLGVLPLHFPEVLGTSQVLGVLPGAYLGPLAAAALVTAAVDGRPGLRRWTGRLTRWRVAPRWYLLVLLGVPVALGLTWSAMTLRPAWPPTEALAAYLPVLALQVISTGLAEEPGWRDFALPRLQPRYGPLRGTLLLGLVWGCWHLPLFLTEWGGWPAVQPGAVAIFLVAAIAFSIVITWVFNRTGESLPVVAILHAGVNTFFSVGWVPLPGGHGDASLVLLVATLLVSAVLLVATRGRLGLPGAVERPTPVGPEASS